MALTKVSAAMFSTAAQTSDLNLDDGTLFVDSSENRVAIGNTAPAEALDITGNLTLRSRGYLKLQDDAGGQFVALRAPATVSSSVTYTLPAADGSSGQTLSTNGSGTLSWANATAAGTGVTLSGTTISIGQAVATSSDVQFNSVKTTLIEYTDGDDAITIVDGGHITAAGNVTVTGNLTVNGATVTNSATNTTIEDLLIELGTGTSGTPANDAGLVLERGSSDNIFIGWDESADVFTVGTGSFTGASTGNLTHTAANAVFGSITGTGLTIDTATLVVDASNNRVGIGNASPDVSLDIGSYTDAVHLPVGTTGQRPGSPAAGYFRYNSSTNQFEGYTDAWGTVGGGSTTLSTDLFTGNGSTVDFTISQAVDNENKLMVFIDGVYQNPDAYSMPANTTLRFSSAPANSRKIAVYSIAGVVSGTNINIDSFTGDGSDTTFTLSITPVNENNTLVYVAGVYQPKSAYSVSGTTLTFSSAPANSAAIEVATFNQTEINVPVDNSITTAKIVDDAVTSDKLASGLTLGGTTTFSGNITVGDSHTIGDDGSSNLVLTSSSGENIILDSAEDIVIDADGGDIYFRDNGTTWIQFERDSGTNNIRIQATDQDKDILFQGNDGGTQITALTLDMSEAGAATFGGEVFIPEKLTHTGDTDTHFKFAGANDIRIVAGNVEHIAFDGTIVINQSAADMDVRIESTGNQNMLYVDSGNDVIGVGLNNPHDYYSKNLVVMADGDGTGGITIAAPATDDTVYLAFADGTSGAAAYAGYVGYAHNTDDLILGAGGGTRLTLDSSSAGFSGTITAAGGAANNNDDANILTLSASEHARLLVDTSSTSGHRANLVLESNSNETVLWNTGSAAGLDVSTGNFTIDAAGDIILDADDGDIILKDGGTTFGQFSISSGDLFIQQPTADKDIILRGYDGSNYIAALTLDMSAGGNATFAGGVTIDPADGVADEAYALSVRNQEATDGRNYGLWVRAGSNSSDESFSVRNHDNSATYLKVRGDGNVGIGETSPSYKLEVNGTAHVVNTLSAGAVTIPSQGLTLNQAFGTGVPTITMLGTTSNGRAGAIHFTEQGDVSTAAIYSTDGGSGNASYGGLTIATYQSDLRFATNGLASTRMIIDSSGKVGIGTTSPSTTLDSRTGTHNVPLGIAQVGTAGYSANYSSSSDVNPGYYGSDLSNNIVGIFRTATVSSTSAAAVTNIVNLYSSNHWGNIIMVDVELYSAYFYPTFIKYNVFLYGTSLYVKTLSYSNYMDSNAPSLKFTGNGNTHEHLYDTSDFSNGSYADLIGSAGGHSGQDVRRTTIAIDSGRSYAKIFAVVKLHHLVHQRAFSSSESISDVDTYLSTRGAGIHFLTIPSSAMSQPWNHMDSDSLV